MKVFSRVNNSRAYARGYKDGKTPKFRAFPTGKNTTDTERAFETEEELGAFLIKNPDWKAAFEWVNEDGKRKNGQHFSKVIP